MAVRRPLVIIAGRKKELPAGDTLPSDAVPSAGNLKLPFYLQSGPSPIPLTGDGALPFFLASGSSSDIPVIT